MVVRKVISSSAVYPFWWMIFICFTMVDLPDSPEPAGRDDRVSVLCGGKRKRLPENAAPGETSALAREQEKEEGRTE